MSNDSTPSSSTASGLETETQHETTTFEHFGRTWEIPAKRHLSHLVKMRNEVRAGINDFSLLAAETMLDEKQFLELCDIDPDEDELEAFATAMSKAMGLSKSGNSKSSSTSS